MSEKSADNESKEVLKEQAGQQLEKRLQLRQSRLDHAAWALETGDPKVIESALWSARKRSDWDVVSFIEESPQFSDPSLGDNLLRSIEEDLQKVRSFFVNYSIYKIDKQLLGRKGAKAIQLECDKHGIFGVSLKTLRTWVRLKDPSLMPLCPLCGGFKEAKEWQQINVRLDLDKSKKIAELVSFYSKKESFNFLGRSAKVNHFFSATNLGRILLEASIDRVHLQMQNELRIDQLAGWIGTEVTSSHAGTTIKEAWNSIKADPAHHSFSNTHEYQAFMESLVDTRAKLYNRSCEEWGEDTPAILFDKYWEKSFDAFLSSQINKEDGKRTAEIELMLKMMEGME